MALIATIAQIAAGSAIARFVFLRSRFARFIVRFALLYLCLAIGSISGCAIAPIMFILGRNGRTNMYTGRTFYAIASRLLGFSCNIDDSQYLDAARPCVFVSNHQSSLDMLPLAAVFPKDTAILAKAEIKWYPFMGQYMMLARNIFINRGNHSSAVETMTEVARQMRERKMGLWMYPEGTRSHQTNKSLLQFKKGAFRLAIESDAPIIPIVVSTYYPCYSESKMIIEPGTINVKVLPPIPTTGMTLNDLDTLMEKTRQIMLDALQTLETVPTDPSSVPKIKQQ